MLLTQEAAEVVGTIISLVTIFPYERTSSIEGNLTRTTYKWTRQLWKLYLFSASWKSKKFRSLIGDEPFLASFVVNQNTVLQTNITSLTFGNLNYRERNWVRYSFHLDELRKAYNRNMKWKNTEVYATHRNSSTFLSEEGTGPQAPGSEAGGEQRL